jgi:putative hydrolase of the HAD superfamily
MVFPGLPPERVAAAERGWWRDRVRSTFLAADSSLRFEDFEGCFGALFDHYAQGDSWRLRPGARTALLDLERQELRLGVVSNFDQRLSQILQQLGIVELLDTVMLPAQCGARKPDARIFEAALHEIDVSPSEAFFLGDDPELDVAGARAAGLRAADVSAFTSLADLPAALATLGDLSQESHERQPS